jgi:hypothetical protein
MRRTGVRHALRAGAAALAVILAGCGSEDHPNEPRSPKPLDITAKVDDRKVVVSPNEFGAGLVVFSISNQSEDEVRLNVDGPVEASSGPIPPTSASDDFKVNLEEGEYVVTTDDATTQSSRLTVGPERPSAQDELLLP